MNTFVQISYNPPQKTSKIIFLLQEHSTDIEPSIKGCLDKAELLEPSILLMGVALVPV